MSEAQRDAYRRELTRDIRVAYYQYLQATEVMAIYAETGALLRELLRTNQRLVANDKATEPPIKKANPKAGRHARYVSPCLFVSSRCLLCLPGGGLFPTGDVL